MAIPQSDRARIIQLLLRDVETTLGQGKVAIVRHFVATIDEFIDDGVMDIGDPAMYRDKLVEEVQQYFHDCFLDTSWPRCPRHPNHPLWLHGESWCCERDDVVIAGLGELKHATMGRRFEPGCP